MATNEVEDFRQLLADDVARLSTGNGQYTVDSFATLMADYLREGEVIPDVSIRAIRANGPHGKSMSILGFGHDVAEDSLNILIGGYASPPYQMIPKTDLGRFMDAGIAFVENSVNGWIEDNLEESSDAVEDAISICEIAKEVKTIKFRVVTNREKSDRVKNIDNIEIAGIPASFDIWDINRTYELSRSSSGREEFTIDFTAWSPKGLLALVGDSGTEAGGDTYLATIPGNILADIFDEYGSRLLEQNVRTFLSTRGKINKGIQKTLVDKPERFLAYNNGLTTTATEMEVVDEGEYVWIHSIKNLQIVNGGQTTSSLSYFRRNNKNSEEKLRNVKVQMKLVLVEESEIDAESLVSAVARYANSQNKVSEADLASNSQYHVDLENLSKRIAAPAEEGKQYQTYWFYERARGQWENQRATSKRRKEFELRFPKNQKIDKTTWAKYQATWAQQPHTVSKGAQANFLEFSKDIYKMTSEKPELVDENYFKTGVAKSILFEKTRSAIMKSNWYETGYLANIVTYTVARFAYELETKFPDMELDFKKIWANQDISGALSDALASIGFTVREILTDETRQQKNVSQYAKTELCWMKVKEAFMLLPNSVITNELVSKKSSSANPQIVYDVLERVIAVPPETYQSILQELNKKSLIAQSEIDVVLHSVIYSSDVKSSISEEDAETLFSLLKRATMNGIIEADSF